MKSTEVVVEFSAAVQVLDDPLIVPNVPVLAVTVADLVPPNVNSILVIFFPEETDTVNLFLA